MLFTLIAVAAITAIPITQLILTKTLHELAREVLDHVAESERVGGEPRIIVEKRLELASQDQALKARKYEHLQERAKVMIDRGVIDPHAD